MNLEDFIRSLKNNGALAIYISYNGHEISFHGNESFKTLVTKLAEVRHVLSDVFRENVSSHLNLNLPIELNDFSLAYMVLTIADMLALIMWKSSITVVVLFSAEFLPIDVNNAIEILRSVEESVTINTSSTMPIDRLKYLFLQARKSVNYGDKESLVQSLLDIKQLLMKFNNPALSKYEEIIDSLVIALKKTELTPEIQLKVKRSLLSIFKNMSKQLEGL